MTARLRAPAAALGVGAVAGLVIAGVGSRLAMRAIAVADGKEDFGLPTEGGDTVGEVTLAGTLFVVFNGALLGIAGAFLYLLLRRWLPRKPLYRAIVFALIVLGLGLTSSINGNDRDFEFANPLVSVLSFGTVLFAYGMVVPTLVDRLAPYSASPSRWGRGLISAILVVTLVSGALSVRHAFEISDESALAVQG